MEQICKLTFFFFLSTSALFSQGLIIQENEIGFCSVDGIIDTDVAGYTGDGFANTNNFLGASGLWNVEVPSAGLYQIFWHYANGGGAGDLLAELWVNEQPFVDVYNFHHTGSWTNWTDSDAVSVQLEEGENRIRLVASMPNGLPNIDFFYIDDNEAAGAFCPPSYSLRLSQNDDQAGVVSYEPVQAYYDAGTTITLTASVNSGYFFQSWSGGETGAEPVHSFNIHKNVEVEALFYPDGTSAVEGVIGYATVQDDEGTPYLMTGGMFGDTVLVSSFGALKFYLESEEPYVVTVADHIVATGQINITSDKTLLGITDSAHLEGIRLKIGDSHNVILQNMILSKVVQFDVLEINDSDHVWIDGCEFFTDKDHGSEFYDGLLDIKNAASFITVSNTEFNDHFKAILISSGDDSFQDTSVRITFHHNFFHDLNSRTPLLRFGKAHMFSNYFRNCNSGINSRMEACIRVEENFFYQMGYPIRTDMSAVVGYFEMVDNIFEESSPFTTPPTCELGIPYEYASVLDKAIDVPSIVAGENPLNPTREPFLDINLFIFPNPAEDKVYVFFDLPKTTVGSLILTDLIGREVESVVAGVFLTGRQQLSFSVKGLPAGIYILHMKTSEGITAERLVIK